MVATDSASLRSRHSSILVNDFMKVFNRMRGTGMVHAMIGPDPVIQNFLEHDADNVDRIHAEMERRGLI